MKTPPHNILAGLLCGLISLGSISAQEPTAPAPAASAPAEPTPEERAARRKALEDKIESFGWTRAGKAQIGTMAEVAIPQGWRFTPGSGAREMLKMFENIPSDEELGLLTTEGLGPWVIFEFNETGYVKDDEKNELDADKLLKGHQEGQEAANEHRKKMGLGPMHVLGWALPPRFNDVTKNLEWALRIGAEDGESINYNTRLLGRHGVMEIELVCSPDELQTLIPQYQSIMANFQYLAGNTYAEYREGDKVAKYGLTALVAGGAAMAAGKMGLFAKLAGLFAKMGKLAIGVVVAIGLGIKALWTKLFGSKDSA
jgi:uncharacterized membrane-anchored protein